jgi:dolichol-phosphate mannosyltransferase
MGDFMARAYFILMTYNEEDSVLNVVKSIMTADLPQTVERILAVNDGSTDRTHKVLEEAAKTYPVFTLNLGTRLGMPLSFKAAFAHLKDYLEDDDLVFTMEADGTNDIKCVPLLAEEIKKGADVVIASRYAPGAKSLGFPWYRLIGSKVINLFLSLMWNIPQVKDYSVLYRVYRGSVLKKYIEEDNEPYRAKKSFAVISEILLRISRYTSKFAEVPLIYDYSLKRGKSKMKLIQTLWEYTRITPRVPLFKQPVFWVAMAAFLSHLIGITYGFPDLLVLDEPSLTRGALTMLKIPTLIPAFNPGDFVTMYYPPLTAYAYLLVLIPVVGIQFLLSGAPTLSAFAGQLALDPTIPWIATRFVSALVGAFGVYLIGRIAERIYPGSGVFAALFLATSFLHTEFSHIARHWTFSFLWITVLLYVAYELYHSAQKRWYVLGGIASGLALGTGVVTVLASLIPGLAHLFRPGPFVQKILSARLWAMVSLAAVIGGIFMALHPLVFTNLLVGAEEQGATIDAPKSLMGLVEIFIVHARDLAQSETILFIFALIGILPFIRRHFRFGLSLIASVLLTIGALYAVHYYLLHYIILILPTLVLFAAAGVVEVVAFARSKWIKTIVIVLIFALPVATSLRFAYLWTLPDTRHDARAYIERTIGQESRIISLTPNMKIVWPNPQTIEERLAFDPGSSRVVDTTLLSLDGEKYPSPSFNVFEIGTFTSEGTERLTPEFLASKDFEYAVVDRFATPVPALEALMARGEIVARFPKEGPAIDILANEFGGPVLDLFKIRQMGPEIWIVKLPQ